MATRDSSPYLPSEWAQQDAVLLTFPHAGSDWQSHLEQVTSVFLKIILTISQYENVVVVCDDRGRVQDLLGAPNKNIHLIEIPSNDTWARDHMGITVLRGNEFLINDFVFNGWGLKFPADKDNLITGKLFEAGLFNKNAKLIKSGFVLEGGAIESDGLGTILTTSECLLSPNRNPQLTKQEIESSLNSFFGSNRVLWLDHGFLEGDDTDSHIDTLARFCTPDTIAYVKCNEASDIHFDSLQKMENQLKSFRTSEGQPYNLRPLPMAKPVFDEAGHRLPATYANFLIINGAVLMPTYNDPETDETAKNVLESCFPDREIICIDCSALILQHGSLHCVTMQVPLGTLKK